MKKIIAAAVLGIFCAGTAFAADEIVLKAKNGNVTFNHKKHQESVKDCKACHEKGPGKIEGFSTEKDNKAIDKDKAHGLCKDCHTKKQAGPTKCGECHKKS